MPIFRLKNFLTINDLNIPSRKLQRVERERYKIAVIDDENFVYYEQLRKLGFNLTKYDDIQDLNMLSSYNVIISDIKGVGKMFNSEFEGAFLLRELKKKYPYKSFAAYTGSAYDIRINSLLSDIQIIKKDIGVEDWSDAIDYLIKETSDPKQIWIKIRNSLLDEEVPLFELAKLEDEYVDILLNKNGDFSKFPSNRVQKGLPASAIKIISSVVSNVVIKTLLPA